MESSTADTTRQVTSSYPLQKHGVGWCTVLAISICLIGLVFGTTMFMMQLKSPVSPAALSAHECLVVRTSAGKVRGTLVQYTVKGTVYSTVAFYGIPFAEPPIGRNRFMETKCVKPWNGTFNATYKRPPCRQLNRNMPKNYTIDASNTTEDCLHINVWVPGTCADLGKPRAVVFWLYGGAFVGGGNSYDFYDGRFLSGLGDLVVAAPNYRVSLFGFLNSGTGRDVRGNMGFHDQVLALRWVRDNIGHFGGDRDNVVVAGQSAGAISLSLLMASPLGSPSTFRRVYLMSGTMNTPLVPNSGDSARATFEAISNATQCLSTDATAILRCLQKRDASELLEASKGMQMRFMPSREPPLLPTGATKIQKHDTSRLEVILSSTLNEGMSFFQNLLPQLQGTKQKDPKETIKLALAESFGDISDSLLDLMIEILRELYDIDDPDYKGWVDLIGDVFFRCPTKSFAIELAESGAKAYYQIYEPKPSFTVFDGDSATHGEDALMLFGTATFLYPHLATDRERETTIRMIRTLANFATNGSVPRLVDGSSWPTVQEGSYKEVVQLTHDGYNHSSPDRDCFLADTILSAIGISPTRTSRRVTRDSSVQQKTLRVVEELIRLYMRNSFT
ncbi:hypothetical protein HPB50_027209 [Hyalomma asiaticum]|uniref:Uncharacterized protein n=1 Tax=Hyalomma asiaticum TaxID=266040 RepID=A0ACB7SLA4_HYAAI|nr:hypothetical protein HPB50_027209 [Hyalomma asiaticum]